MGQPCAHGHPASIRLMNSRIPAWRAAMRVYTGAMIETMQATQETTADTDDDWVRRWDETSPARLTEKERDAFINDCDRSTPAVRLLLLMEELMIGSTEISTRRYPYPNMLFQDGRHGYAGFVDDGGSSRQRRNMLALAGMIQSEHLNGDAPLLELLKDHPEQAASEGFDIFRIEDGKIPLRGPLPAMIALGLRNPQWAGSMTGMVRSLCEWSAHHPPEHGVGLVPAALIGYSGTGLPIPVECVSMIAAAVDAGFSLGPYDPMMSADTVTMTMMTGDNPINVIDVLRESHPERLPARERMMDILEHMLRMRMGSGPLSDKGCKWRNRSKHWEEAESTALYALATHPLFMGNERQAIIDVVGTMDAMLPVLERVGGLRGIRLASWPVLSGLAGLPYNMIELLNMNSFSSEAFIGVKGSAKSAPYPEDEIGLQNILAGIDWAKADEEGAMSIARRIFPSGFAITGDPFTLLDNDGRSHWKDKDQDRDERRPVFIRFMLGCLECGENRLAVDMALLDRIICGVCDSIAENGRVGEHEYPIPVVITGTQLQAMIREIIDDGLPEKLVVRLASEECVSNMYSLYHVRGNAQYPERIEENGRYGLPTRTLETADHSRDERSRFHVGIRWDK